MIPPQNSDTYWRLLLDPPRDPYWNMAVDETLVRGAGPGASDRITLRLYAWDPPSVSLGRFQPPLPPAARRFCRDRGIAWVRRPTGGGSVLHSDEITYSLSAPLGREPFPRSVVRIYERISAGLRRGLQILGIAVDGAEKGRSMPPRKFTEPCFSRIGRWEICWSGKKLLGSAQVRCRQRFLQHGSLPIQLDRKVLLRAVEGGSRTPAAILPAVSLSEALGRTPRRDEVEKALVRGFAEIFGVGLREGALTHEEAETARALIPKYRKTGGTPW